MQIALLPSLPKTYLRISSRAEPVAERAWPSAPPAYEEGYEKFYEGDTHQSKGVISRGPCGPTGVQAYPVIETPDPNNPRQVVQQPLFKELKQLKEAVSSYGLLAPFTVSMFKSYASLNLTPSDWQQLWRAVLSGGDYLLWRGEYQEKYIQTACLNAQAGFPNK